jgi:hypothetical protein
MPAALSRSSGPHSNRKLEQPGADCYLALRSGDIVHEEAHSSSNHSEVNDATLAATARVCNCQDRPIAQSR